MKSLPLLISIPSKEDSLVILSRELDFSDEEKTLARSLLDKGLPPLVKLSVLPYLFGISAQLIGYMGRYPHKFYRSFTIKKANGSERQISSPRRFLKIVQTWIYTHVCANQPLEACVTGFVTGKSIFTNGSIHANNGNLMVIDISKFFPSVKIQQVNTFFLSLSFPKEVAYQLSSLTCLNSCLPQGAPTSPALANLVFKPIDLELLQLSSEWGCKYSRYADDMAFSGKRVFTKADIIRVATILGRYGFTVNNNKSRIIGRGGKQVVSGLVVNQCVLPSREIRRRWRAIFHNASSNPKDFTDRVTSLFGIASFTNQYSPKTYEEYRKKALYVEESKRQ